jgi:hypothetical protein
LGDVTTKNASRMIAAAQRVRLYCILRVEKGTSWWKLIRIMVLCNGNLEMKSSCDDDDDDDDVVVVVVVVVEVVVVDLTAIVVADIAIVLQQVLDVFAGQDDVDVDDDDPDDDDDDDLPEMFGILPKQTHKEGQPYYYFEKKKSIVVVDVDDDDDGGDSEWEPVEVGKYWTRTGYQ